MDQGAGPIFFADVFDLKHAVSSLLCTRFYALSENSFIIKRQAGTVNGRGECFRKNLEVGEIEIAFLYDMCYCFFTNIGGVLAAVFLKRHKAS